MAIESPLFQSSMELFGHSFSHYNASNELDRKLVILHLANAIELILKDLVLDSGESIYKSPKETITIHGCIKSLHENSKQIPFLNKVELLIDERNALQHRFGSPNELTTIFYMNIAQDFFKEVLSEHYDQNYEEVLTQFVEEKELIAFKMREPSDDAELENLKKLSRVHPLGALLSAMTYLEKYIINFTEVIGISHDFKRRPIWHTISHRYLEQFGIDLPDDLSAKMNEIRHLRNLAAHGRKEPKKEEVTKAINTIEEYEKFMQSVDLKIVKKNVKKHIKHREEMLNKRRADEKA